MNKMAHKLSGTIGICTACCRFVITNNGIAARRTQQRKYKRFCIFGMFAYRKHFGNYLARFAYYYGVAYADSFFFNKITVVQCCTADGCTCKQYRFKYAHGRENSCPAYIDFNIKQFCRLFFGRIFICFRPFRIFCGTAEQFSCRKAVNLYNCAVNGVIIFTSVISDFFYLLYCFVNSIAYCIKRRWKAKLGKVIKALAV